MTENSLHRQATDLPTPTLSVENLSISVPGVHQAQTIVADLSFQINQGEILGIVGDSGCGKTMTALAVAGLLPDNATVSSGKIILNGQNIQELPAKDRRQLLGRDIGMIFQEPLTALNPVMTVGKQLAEVLTSHQSRPDNRKEKLSRHQTILEMLANVGFEKPDQAFAAYPHQLSGGQRQRALIAGCLLLKPSLLIADEPTTALDTVTQAQILDQLRRISQDLKISVLFISHNIMLMRSLCDKIAIMQDHQISKIGIPANIFQASDIKAKYSSRPDFLTEIPPTPAALPQASGTPLISLCQISAGYNNSLLGGKKHNKQILTNVSLDVYPKEIVGLVGTSGCGKTTLARVLTGLLPADQGQIYENGQLTADFSRNHKKIIRPNIGLIFQDPYSSLHPLKTIGWIMEEPLRANKIGDKESRKHQVLAMLEEVGLPPNYSQLYPHQLSGGQRQRVAIATSLMLSPSLIIADEPVSALDASVQTQILDLLKHLHDKKGLSILLISHDLRVIADLCSRVAVMERGKIVESGTLWDVFHNPQHNTTKQLLSAEL